MTTAAAPTRRRHPKPASRRLATPTLPKAPSALEARFDRAWRCLRPEGLPLPVAEHRFDEARRWRFDRAWPAERVAVELEGGLYRHARTAAGKPTGRHTSVTGFVSDCDKYNAAAAAGWIVLRFTEKHFARNEVAIVDQVAAALRARRAL